MKNKKLFKTLTISASSLAVAAAAIAAPIIVTASKSINRTPKKKDGKSNADAYAWGLDGNAITSLNLYYNTKTEEQSPVTYVRFTSDAAGQATLDLSETNMVVTLYHDEEELEETAVGKVKASYWVQNKFVKLYWNFDGTLGDKIPNKITITTKGETSLTLLSCTVTPVNSESIPEIHFSGHGAEEEPIEILKHSTSKIKLVESSQTNNVNWNKVQLYGKTNEEENFTKLTNNGNGEYEITVDNANNIDVFAAADGVLLSADPITSFDVVNMRIKATEEDETQTVYVAPNKEKTIHIVTNDSKVVNLNDNTIWTISSSGSSVQMLNSTIAELQQGILKIKGGATESTGEFSITLAANNGTGYDTHIINVNVQNEKELVPSATSLSINPGSSETLSVTYNSEPISGLTTTSTISGATISEIGTTGTYTVSINASAVPGSGTITFNDPNGIYKSCTVSLTINDTTDYTLTAPTSAMGGVVNGSDISIPFKPVNDKVAEELTTSEWDAQIVGGLSSQVATFDGFSVERDATTNKNYLAAKVKPGTIAGAGVIQITRTGTTKVVGSATFYISQYQVSLGCSAITNNKISIYNESDLQLTASIPTVTTTAASYKWRSSNTDICEVDNEGKLTIKNITDDVPVTLTAVYKDDPWSQATYQLTIEAPKTSDLSFQYLEGSSYIDVPTSMDVSLAAGSTQFRLLGPQSANLTANKYVKWHSAATDVASFSDVAGQEGLLQYNSAGTSIISVYIERGSYKSEILTAEVNVTTNLYKFTGGDETIEYHEHEVAHYISNKISSKTKTLKITSGESASLIDLSQFSFNVKPFDLETKEVIETTGAVAPIYIDESDNCKVKLVANATTNSALITADKKGEAGSDEFYAVYTLDEAEKVSIEGFDEQNPPSLSDKNTTLSVTLGQEIISGSDDYEVTYSFDEKYNDVLQIDNTTGKVTWLDYYDSTEESKQENQVPVTATVKNKTSQFETTAEITIYAVKDTIASESIAYSGKAGESQAISILVNNTKLTSTELASKVEFTITDSTTGETSNIAEITDNNSTIKFKSKGQANLNIKYWANGINTGAAQIKQVATIDISDSDLTINYTWVWGYPGQESVQLQTYGLNAQGQEEVVTSTYAVDAGGESVCEVTTSGKITLKNSGTAKIIATASDGTGRKAYCQVDVDAAAKFELSQKSISASLSDKGVSLKAFIGGEQVSDNVVWSVPSDQSAISVDQTGYVTYNTVTTSPVTVTAVYLGTLTATCQIEVNDFNLTTNIPASSKMLANGTKQIHLFIDGIAVPMDAEHKIYGKVVTFTATGSVTVSEGGLITAASTTGTGTVKITWNGKTITLNIRVI